MIPDEELHESITHPVDRLAPQNNPDLSKRSAIFGPPGPINPDPSRFTTVVLKPYEPCPPPATPPSAEPAEETSGGERCTAAGAGSCCHHMVSAIQYGAVTPSRVLRGLKHPAVLNLRQPTPLPFWFCPWCGAKLGGER